MSPVFKSKEDMFAFWAKYPQETRLPHRGGVCGTHGNDHLWTSIYGAVACGVCHPPVSEDIVRKEVK